MRWLLFLPLLLGASAVTIGALVAVDEMRSAKRARCPACRGRGVQTVDEGEAGGTVWDIVRECEQCLGSGRRRE